MLSFRTPSIEDRQWVLPLLDVDAPLFCEYSFPVLFCWRGSYHQEIAFLQDKLLVHLHSSIGSSYLWPVGGGDAFPALEALRQDAAARGEPFRLVCLTAAHCALLEQWYPGAFSISETCTGADYIYDINRLAELPGKKLHAKRTHIRRFEDACPNWEFAPLCEADASSCLELDERWYQQSIARMTGANVRPERDALYLALSHFSALGLEGGVIRHEGTVVAFALGANLNPSVYDVHFERADTERPGTYAIINREFARFIRETHPTVHFVNREDDMGLPGLQKAKRSYYPDYMEEKFCAVHGPTPF